MSSFQKEGGKAFQEVQKATALANREDCHTSLCSGRMQVAQHRGQHCGRAFGSGEGCLFIVLPIHYLVPPQINPFSGDRCTCIRDVAGDNADWQDAAIDYIIPRPIERGQTRDVVSWGQNSLSWRCVRAANQANLSWTHAISSD